MSWLGHWEDLRRQVCDVRSAGGQAQCWEGDRNYELSGQSQTPQPPRRIRQRKKRNHPHHRIVSTLSTTCTITDRMCKKSKIEYVYVNVVYPTMSYEHGLKGAVNNTPVSIRRHVQYFISLNFSPWIYLTQIFYLLLSKGTQKAGVKHLMPFPVQILCQFRVHVAQGYLGNISYYSVT